MTSVFVYGSLRPGEPNHRLLATAATITPATMANLQLYSVPNLGFPYALAMPTKIPAQGHLATFETADAPAALRRLDILEGYDADADAGHYLRRLMPATTRKGTVDAWVYIASPRVSRRNLTPITNNDWSTHPR